MAIFEKALIPIHTILHPTDFSLPSSYAFALARALARDYQARLVILHVIAPPTAIYAEPEVLPQLEDRKPELEQKLDQMKATTDPSVRVEHLLKEGDPAAEILEAAQEVKADIIVMGTHGRTGLARLLMGSVAEHVLRKASCPVMTVRDKLEV